MENIVVKETQAGTELYIDGVQMRGILEFKLEKRSNAPMELSLSGVVFSEVQAGTL